MADFDKRDFDILVAKCGKSIGLKGEIRLIVYSDFSEIWQKGNVFLCKGDSVLDSSLRGRIVDSYEAIQKKNQSRDSANLVSLPIRGAKNRIQTSSSASADFLLEKDLRGSPPKSEKRQLLARRGSGVGGAALLRKETSESKSKRIESDLQIAKIDSSLRTSCYAQNDGMSADCHENSLRSFFRNDGTMAFESPNNDDNNAFFLTLKSFNPHKQSAFFDEIDSVESVKNLTSMLLYSSEFLTQKYCHLGENEHFWFEIVGMSVVDNGEIMGAVSNIERIGSVDYLLVATNQSILAKYPHIKAKKFYIPYIPRYIVRIDKNANAIQSPPQTRKDSPKGTIFVRDSLGILEES